MTIVYVTLPSPIQGGITLTAFDVFIIGLHQKANTKEKPECLFQVVQKKTSRTQIKVKI
jgi:hypothetical protein